MVEFEKTLKDINRSINEIGVKVDKLQFINIKNGGGRRVQFLRDEFFQMLYDRPKDTFYNMGKFSRNALQIIDFAGKIAIVSGIIYILFVK